jgi:acyl-CoA reductase-like NAD-dependent aldehyde dehydrogenase
MLLLSAIIPRSCSCVRIVGNSAARALLHTNSIPARSAALASIDSYNKKNTSKRMGQGVLVEDGCLVNTNPATGEVISRVPCTTLDNLKTIIALAKEAQPAWAFRTTLDERMDKLQQALQLVKERSADLEHLIVQEMGKPLAQAKEEMEFAVNKEKFLTLLKTSLQPKTFGNSTVVRHPLGVVAILSPWNFPVDEVLLLALPSLASGNTGMIKGLFYLPFFSSAGQ